MNKTVQRRKKLLITATLTLSMLLTLITPGAVPAASAAAGINDLKRSVQALIDEAAAKGIRVSVGLKDLSGYFGNEEALLGSKEAYKPASTIKLALVAALMQQVDRGALTLEDTVTVEPDDVVGGTGSLQKESFPQDVSLERLARLMITQSDNTATNVLIDVVGLKRVQELMDQLNLEVMHLGRKMFAAAPTPEQDNFINAADLITLLDRIYKHSFLTEKSKDTIIGWMLAQEVDTKFGAALQGAKIAHKTGENANVTHDTGYFLVPGREMAVAVLTEVTTTEDFDEAQSIGNPVVQEIAKAIYGFLQQSAAGQPQMAVTRFLDVPDHHWAKAEIEKAVYYGLLSGSSDTEFSPAEPITRADFVSALARAQGLPEEGEDTNAAAAAQPITRAQMITLFMQAYANSRSNGLPAASALNASDADQVPAWAKDSFSQAQQLGILKGYVDGSLRPGMPATRAEAAKLVSLLLP